jgi:hypothetical protein
LSISTTVVSGIGKICDAAMSLPITKSVWLAVTLGRGYNPSLVNHAYSADIKGGT